MREKNFKIGQRVKILEHKGTCFENATGTVIEINKNTHCLKVYFEKEEYRFLGKTAFWFADYYLKAIKDEPKQELTQEQIQEIVKNIDFEALKECANKLAGVIQEVLYQYGSAMVEVGERLKEQFKKDGGEDE